MDIDSAARRLLRGIEQAQIRDRYGERISDPETSRKYSKNFAEFIGHPVQRATENYLNEIPHAIDNWTRKPTNAEKWKEALKHVR